MLDYKIYILGHSESSFEKIPNDPHFHNLDLNSLKLPIENTNHIAETRFFLQDESVLDNDPDYVGLLTWRYDAKYPKMLKLSDLHPFISDNLRPNTVLCPQRTIDENNGQWVTQPERYIKGGKGITYHLKELAELMGLPLEPNPSIWANNFICHKTVLKQLMAFFKKAFYPLHKKYGYDGYGFEVIGNQYPIRNVAFFYELVSLLFFSQRPDLNIISFPERQLNKGKSFHHVAPTRPVPMSDIHVVGPQKTFHVLGYPHTKINKNYVHCAYTQKMYNFAKMMMSLGHKVYIYGREDCTAPCTEHIICFDAEDEKRTMLPNTLWTGQHEAFKLMNERIIVELGKRQSQKDFICTLAGHLQSQVSNTFPHLTTVEYGIGYSGVFAKFRVFESYAWMHCFYGAAANGDASNADGNNYDCVIPNYYDPNDFDFSAEKDDYYLYIGRLAARKGVEIASTVCNIMGAKLIVAGAEGNPPSYGEYVGLVDLKRRSELMRRAKAVFVPTIYVEPFGGVHAEAMMCGTPVITSDWGVFSETVVPGVVGYRCRTIGEYLQAARNVSKLDPHRIRKYALKNFGIDRVRWQYEAYFNQLLELWGDGFYSRKETDVNRYGRILDLGTPEEGAFEAKKPPLVSCYCLTYGRPHCLEEAIECFLKQDYTGPKELVILNDRADQELVFDHPEVRIINVKERIVPLGRKHNEAIKHCKGEILMCWDDDDIFLPNRISYTMNHMNRGIFHTRAGYSEDAIEKYSLFPENAVAHSTHAMTREIFDSVGGYPDTDHVAVDQIFMRRLYDKLGEYSQPMQENEIFYVYRWKTVTTYHTSDCPSDTTNVSELTELKVEARIKNGEIPTGRIELKPRWKYDYTAVARAMVKPKMAHIWYQPQFGEPWFSYPKLYAEFVKNADKNGRIVEVGSWKGKSTAYLGVEVINSGKNILIDAVDTWKGTPGEKEHDDDWHVQNGKLYDLFIENIKPITRGLHPFDVIQPIRLASLDAAKLYPDKSVDAVFIDAAHDYDSVVADIKAWLPKVKPGGYIAGHDWDWESVRKAVIDTLPQAKPNDENCWVLKCD